MKSKRRIFALLVACLVPLMIAGCCEHKSDENRISERVFEYVIIDASPQEVWDYAWNQGVIMDRTAGEMTLEWYPGVVFSEFNGAGEGGFNKYFVEVEGKEYTGTAVTIVDVPPRRQVAKWFGDIEGTWTFLCVPHNNGSKLMIIDEYSFVVKPDMGMSGEKLADLFNQGTVNALKTIKEKVEGK